MKLDTFKRKINAKNEGEQFRLLRASCFYCNKEFEKRHTNGFKIMSFNNNVTSF